MSSCAVLKVFSLPPSVLRRPAPGPAETQAQGDYKAAVDAFLQQQLVLGARDSPPPAPGEGQPHQPHPQGRPGPQSWTAAQTQALCRLFESVKTLTAREELLQTLR